MSTFLSLSSGSYKSKGFTSRKSVRYITKFPFHSPFLLYQQNKESEISWWERVQQYTLKGKIAKIMECRGTMYITMVAQQKPTGNVSCMHVQVRLVVVAKHKAGYKFIGSKFRNYQHVTFWQGSEIINMLHFDRG